MTLLLETGAVGFVWHPRLRRVWLVGVVGLHLGIALLLNLWTFSATMIVFDLAAFAFAPQGSCDTHFPKPKENNNQNKRKESYAKQIR